MPQKYTCIILVDKTQTKTYNATSFRITSTKKQLYEVYGTHCRDIRNISFLTLKDCFTTVMFIALQTEQALLKVIRQINFCRSLKKYIRNGFKSQWQCLQPFLNHGPYLVSQIILSVFDQ